MRFFLIVLFLLAFAGSANAAQVTTEVCYDDTLQAMFFPAPTGDVSAVFFQDECFLVAVDDTFGYPPNLFVPGTVRYGAQDVPGPIVFSGQPFSDFGNISAFSRAVCDPTTCPVAGWEPIEAAQDDVVDMNASEIHDLLGLNVAGIAVLFDLPANTFPAGDPVTPSMVTLGTATRVYVRIGARAFGSAPGDPFQEIVLSGVAPLVVPEPSVSATLLAGVLGLGVLFRSR